MKELEIINGEIRLDGEKIPCIKSFNIAGTAKNPGVAELTICMEVTVEPKVFRKEHPVLQKI